MKKTVGLATVVLISLSVLCSAIFLNPSVQANSATGEWPMFGSDPSHSGVGTGNPVLTSTVLWNFSAPEILGPKTPLNPFSDETELYSPGFGSPAVVDGVVYIGSDNNNVYAFNASNGVQLWSHSTNGGEWSCPAVVGGVVYIQSSDGYLFALNASSGIQLWNYSTEGSDFSSPTVVNGLVYIGSLDSNVYALNAANGTKLWIYKTGNAVRSSPAVVNGVVYVGSDDGNVYALSALTNQIGVTPQENLVSYGFLKV